MSLRRLQSGTSAVFVGSMFTAISLTPAKADQITDRIVQNVIQNILQNVRDQVQGRRLVAPASPGRLQFTGDSDGQLSAVDDPFAALAYAKAPMYTKASPVVAAPAPTYLYGLNLIGSGDSSRAAGITVTSFGGTGAADITKIGIFSAYDALTFVFTGTGVWSNAPGIDTNTGVGAGTIAYLNGGFSTDFTISGSWSSTSGPAIAPVVGVGPIAVGGDTTGLSYAPNVQYKFELGNGWYIEPTVGATYTQTFTADFGSQTGDSTEVHGGARFGTETTWNGVRVQPSLKLEAFSMVAQSGVGATAAPGGIFIPSASIFPTGQVGGRASGKLNVLWTPAFSSFVEAHGTGLSGFSSYGALGGFRWTF